jgi:membrane-associated phospholipid phosphatase
MTIQCKSLLQLLLIAILLLSAPYRAHSSDAVATAGDAALVAVAAVAGGVTLCQKDTEGMIQLAKSSALDLAVTYGLKYAVSERRPNDEDNHSFPSAHASVSFTAAEYLRKRYGWEYGLPAYAVASFIGYSRVESKSHYVHDVLAGAAIGMASSYLFTTPYRDMKLAADISPGYLGVKLSSAW